MTKAIPNSTLSLALVTALAEIGGATKDKVNPAFKSKYADIGSVIDAIKPVLARHDLAFTQSTEPSDAGVIVETILWHTDGEKQSLGKLFVPANKHDAQGFGSALTYARRYSLMTAFGVPAEDDDGNAAVRAPRADPVDAKMLTDNQRDLIATLAPVAGKTVQGICEAYRVGSLKELTQAQGDSILKRLQPETESAK